jgi:hypothetical protein
MELSPLHDSLAEELVPPSQSTLSASSVLSLHAPHIATDNILQQHYHHQDQAQYHPQAASRVTHWEPASQENQPQHQFVQIQPQQQVRVAASPHGTMIVPGVTAAYLHQHTVLAQHVYLEQLQQQQQQQLKQQFVQQQQYFLLQQQQQQAQPVLHNVLVPEQSPFVTHNLIPRHLQGNAILSSQYNALDGTPGHPAALIVPPHYTPTIGSSTAIHQLYVPPPSQQQSLIQNTPINKHLSTIWSPLPLDQNLTPDSLPVPSSSSTPTATTRHAPVSVQDCDLLSTTPLYNGVNPFYPGLITVNTHPPIFAVENFLSSMECEFLIHVSQDCFGPAPVVGKGSGEISASRTSSTCYLAREDLPDLLRK